jgi:alcohol dehydrogenase (NADP+)
MGSAAAAIAGAGAASLLNLQTASAAETRNAVAPGDGPFPAEGMAAYSPTGPHRLMRFQRRALGPKDVAIKIHYCGVCHSDIHTIRGDWGKIQYPQIVGHELAGEVVAVGSSVSRFNVGARAGVGAMVNSCRVCTECQAGHENYCLNGNTQTYGSKDRDGTITQGGYSTFVVVDEDFVINIPGAIELAEAVPLLCAGITVYSPPRRWGVSPGKKVAVVGMGGLGRLAVKLAAALGAEVTVFTTSPDKVSDARRFGAKDVVINRGGADFSKFNHAFDFALDTVPYKHDLNRFIPLQPRGASQRQGRVDGEGRRRAVSGEAEPAMTLTRAMDGACRPRILWQAKRHIHRRRPRAAGLRAVSRSEGSGVLTTGGYSRRLRRRGFGPAASAGGE